MFGARQIVTFVVAWVAYAGTYLLRKPLGVVSQRLSSRHGDQITERVSISMHKSP